MWIDAMLGNAFEAVYALCNGLYFMTDWCCAKEAIRYHQSIFSTYLLL